jgi:hypothetical protein
MDEKDRSGTSWYPGRHDPSPDIVSMGAPNLPQLPNRILMNSCAYPRLLSSNQILKLVGRYSVVLLHGIILGMIACTRACR